MLPDRTAFGSTKPKTTEKRGAMERIVRCANPVVVRAETLSLA